MTCSAALVALLLAAGSARPAIATEFNYHNALVAYIILSGDRTPATMVDEWMQQFRPEIWARYSRDEFQINARRAEMRKQIDSDLANFKPTEPFVITTQGIFGEYDFARGVFEFNPLSENQFFTVQGGYNNLPREFQLYFSNPDLVDGIKIAPTQAPQFLQAHPNRQVQLVIRAHPVSVPSEHQILTAIDAVSIRDPFNANRVIQEVRAPAAP